MESTRVNWTVLVSPNVANKKKVHIMKEGGKNESDRLILNAIKEDKEENHIE